MHHLVITTINAPTPAVIELASGATKNGWHLVVIGDRKSPPSFELEGADYYDLERQFATGFKFAEAVPTGHYARKNVGYLLAIANGAETIVETDDDNRPLANFWDERPLRQHAPTLHQPGWVNIYRYFTDRPIWPRGLPLDEIQKPVLPKNSLASDFTECPVHQGLANGDPDVDAIYRLAMTLPVDFDDRGPIVTRGEAWCPFNSQNTRWFPEAYPLLYLPFHCSFRMTDIWRSFVVQRILYGNGKGILFHDASVYQDRNEHNLMRDFGDEVVGYQNNREIRQRLLDLELGDRPETMASDLELCYELLISMELVGADERGLLKAWLHDYDTIVSQA
ncbi:MAG: STELLO glycosyltransferase family protein [Sphingomicrobium sp.]